MIDAHHHFWRYNDAEFSWITPDMAVLRRDFGPADLHREMTATGISGAISVQARTCLEETDDLLRAAAEHDFILGVVSWIDLKSPTAAADLDRYVAHPKFKGVREVCQGAPDEQFFTNTAFHAGMRALTQRRLPYDLLIFADQLPAATAFVDQHPDQQFILDHCAKPEIIAAEPPVRWRQNIIDIARRPNVACKLSGLATEIRRPYQISTFELLTPYFDVVLSAFGPDRIMLGSDWPVLNLRSDYAAWFELLDRWMLPQSAGAIRSIQSDVAKRIYQLP